jgi:membrane dipeptidase
MTKTAAHQLYAETIVVDALQVSNWESAAVFRSLEASGVTAINATCAIWDGFVATLDAIAAWLGRFETHQAWLRQIRTADDIWQAKQAGQVGVILGFQNASPIEDRLDRLALFHALGVRVIQLTFNERNRLGNGCYERADDGLSHFGLDAVREMNRLGILIDLSHVGDRTTLETIEESAQPVAVTHANARVFFDHPRNKPDEALRRLAARGGVVGANAFTPFMRRGFASTVQDYGDVIDDLVQRVGIDHVGLGTDYTQDQPAAFFDYCFAQQGTKRRIEPLGYPDPLPHPAGIETPDKLVNVAVELDRRGYSAAAQRQILGGNWLRLFGEVWRTG